MDLGQTIALNAVLSDISAGRVKNQINIQKEAQKELMDYQNSLSRSTYEYQLGKEREENSFYWENYNSPTAQRAAYEEAGLNPEMLMGAGGAGGSVGSSGAAVGGTSIPGAPTVDMPNPFMTALEASSKVESILEQKQKIADLQSAAEYNQDARKLQLQEAAARLRTSLATAGLQEKRLGVFDKDQYRTDLQFIDQLLNSSNGRLRSNMETSLDLARFYHDMEAYENEAPMREAQLEGQRLDNKFKQQDVDSYDTHGYRPGRGPEGSQILDFLFGTSSGSEIRQTFEDKTGFSSEPALVQALAGHPMVFPTYAAYRYMNPKSRKKEKEDTRNFKPEYH